jgi:hypothetical protein
MDDMRNFTAYRPGGGRRPFPGLSGAQCPEFIAKAHAVRYNLKVAVFSAKTEPGRNGISCAGSRD